MRDGEPLGPEADRYLADAEAALAGLAGHARVEVLAELRDHLARWSEELGRAPEDLTYVEVEAELGPAAALGTWSGANTDTALPLRRRTSALLSWVAACAVPVAAAVGVCAYAVAGHLPYRGASTPSVVHVSSSSAAASDRGVSADRTVAQTPTTSAEPDSTELSHLMVLHRALSAQVASLAAQQQGLSRSEQALTQQRGQLMAELNEVTAQERSVESRLAAEHVRTFCGDLTPGTAATATRPSTTPAQVIVATPPACVETAR